MKTGRGVDSNQCFQEVLQNELRSKRNQSRGAGIKEDNLRRSRMLKDPTWTSKFERKAVFSTMLKMVERKPVKEIRIQRSCSKVAAEDGEASVEVTGGRESVEIEANQNAGSRMMPGT